jgi:hypothetical protein
MIKRDYHNFTLEQAMINAHDVIGLVRGANKKANKAQDAEFIVGHGVIRDELVNLLQSYGLKPSTKLGNTGVIICLIE